ncbi:MAG: ABC transporter permease [Deltaproteobacteria bacterium]|nr:ABC transporter permease [Deltaproteobacteria bacterium]
MKELKSYGMKLLYKWSPQQFLVELLSKRWAEAIFPFLIMLVLVPVFGSVINGYFSLYNAVSLAREFSEFYFVAMAMALVIISGGIDMSVGTMYASANFFALLLFQVFGWPVWALGIAVVGLGAFQGAVNGFLIGFMKTRAFLTTLVTMILYGAIVSLSNKRFAIKIAMGENESAIWDFLAEGDLFWVPSGAILFVVVGAVAPFLLTRTRPGWHLTAIGANRKAARHAGIEVERTIFFTYVLSGVFCSIAGLFYATRVGSTDPQTGSAFEILALSAVVLGGVSLGGGRGTIGRALIGATIIMLLRNGLIQLGVDQTFTMVIFGLIMLAAVGADIKWLKNRANVLDKIYVVPTYMKLPTPLDQVAEEDDKIGGRHFTNYTPIVDHELIGLGEIDGPEDPILDRQGRLYAGVRQGWIYRFSGENHSQKEIFANIGGRPLGMAFDKDDNLITCVSGMGLYGVRPDGEVFKLTDTTNRTWWKIIDDTRMRLADDLDIAPDGKIYFSEATIRYDSHTWACDSLEGRGNGRIICYDPATHETKTVIRDLIFPNGICLSHDGQSIYFAETWACRISQYWIAGPKRGHRKVLIPNLPGYPDNINRSSDGNYWLALIGMRTPSYDLAMQLPSFRTHMVKRIPPDEWLYPNINTGCVMKYSAEGVVLHVLWDKESTNHASITSMREHKGYLYLGGIANNRIGKFKLEGADPNWTGPSSYWGEQEV